MKILVIHCKSLSLKSLDRILFYNDFILFFLIFILSFTLVKKYKNYQIRIRFKLNQLKLDNEDSNGLIKIDEFMKTILPNRNFHLLTICLFFSFVCLMK